MQEEPRWDQYPLVAADPHGRAWLSLLYNRGKAPKTVEAYGRALNAFLAFISTESVSLPEVTEEHVAKYIRHMLSQGNLRHTSSAGPLKNSTMQQRLTVLRLLYDYLLRKRVVALHPAPRGTLHKNRSKSVRGVLARERRLPWIPTDEEWLRFLQQAQAESARNRLMILLAYEGALRRQTLVGLEVADVDVSRRLVTVRPEIDKGGRGYVVTYSAVTARLVTSYLHELKAQSGRSQVKSSALFRSLSDRNYGAPLTASSWNKIVTSIAIRAGLPRFTTHTFRHLRLTHMARVGFELYEIAKYAGHTQPQTTMLYIHLSGVDLQRRFEQVSSQLEEHLALLTLGDHA